MANYEMEYRSKTDIQLTFLRLKENPWKSEFSSHKHSLGSIGMSILHQAAIVGPWPKLPTWYANNWNVQLLNETISRKQLNLS